VITARHRNIALLVAGCYFMEMLDGTNITVSQLVVAGQGSAAGSQPDSAAASSYGSPRGSGRWSAPRLLADLLQQLSAGVLDRFSQGIGAVRVQHRPT
jgi:hypothetical protein